MEALAMGFALSVFALIGLIMLSFPKEVFHVTGSAVPFDLVAVRPDESDELYDVRGNRAGTSPFDTNLTQVPANTAKGWVSNIFRRDFIFNLPEAVRVQPVGYEVKFGDRWNSAAENFPQPAFTTGSSYTVAATFPDNYWRSSMFFSSSRAVDFVDLTLSFYQTNRGPPLLTFKGPFAAGVTNKQRSSTQQWMNASLVFPSVPGGGETNTSFRFWVPSMGYPNHGALSFLTLDGRRHLSHITNVNQNSGSWMWGGDVSGVQLGDIASAEFHLPEQKTFHHVRVSYPGRRQRAAAKH